MSKMETLFTLEDLTSAMDTIMKIIPVSDFSTLEKIHKSVAALVATNIVYSDAV